MGVVTYFLLCGYTPFGAPLLLVRSWLLHTMLETDALPSYAADRDNQVDEIQAICNADFAFEPEEYWVGVSDTGASRRLCSTDCAVYRPWWPPGPGCFPCQIA